MSTRPAPGGGVLAGVRLLSELALVTALAFVGAALADGAVLSALVGLALPMLAVAVWGTFVAPRARRRLDDPARLVVEILLFAAAVAGLLYSGYVAFAVVLAVLYAVGAAHGRAGG
jgi:hypothetical protein